jgi:hypothetical protein
MRAARARDGPVRGECTLSAGDLRQEIYWRSLKAFLPHTYHVTLRHIASVIEVHCKGWADILRSDGSWNMFFVSDAVVVVRWNDVCYQWYVRAFRPRRARWSPAARVFFRE